MTINEKRLLRVFLILCSSLIIGLSIIVRIDKLSEIRAGITRYEKALAESEGIHDQLNELRARLSGSSLTQAQINDENNDTRELPSILSTLRESLTAEGIKPERYTISGKEPKQSIEFSFKAHPVHFFRFLEKQVNTTTGASFTYINMRYIKDSPEYDIVFRVKHEQ